MSQVETNSRSDQFESRIAGLEQLLSVLERTIVEQSGRLELDSGAESHLAAIVQSANDAIVTISPDMRVTSWNPGAERLLGFSLEEALDQRVTDLYVPADAREWVEKQILEDFAAVARDPTTVRRIEVPLQRKDAGLVHVSLVATGLFDAEHKVLGMSIIMRDISGRRRAEGEQALLAAIVSSTDDAIISLSPDLLITTWNRGAEKLLGFTATEAVGQPVTIFNPPEARARVEEAVARELARARDHQLGVDRLEPLLQKKDGTRFYASLVIAGIYDAQGAVIGLSGIITDISERKRAEREQALLASIVECSGDAIVGVSTDGKIASWNRGAERLFGFSAGEAIGQPYTIFIRPEDHEFADQNIKQLQKQPGPGHQPGSVQSKKRRKYRRNLDDDFRDSRS